MSAGIRQSPRFAVEAAVTLRQAEQTASGRTSNVSSGGLCATVDRAMPRGATIDVELALVFDEASISEPLVLPARVVWATEVGPGRHQVGVSFLALPDAQKTYLGMFLRYLQDGKSAAGTDGGSEDPFE
ncbi:MAG TPA: PilZ domain-containing protein [Kofleriaceae bacterium]|nr:PilZ domain-containing protein [Kofleriaceae bacterium]